MRYYLLLLYTLALSHASQYLYRHRKKTHHHHRQANDDDKKVMNIFRTLNTTTPENKTEEILIMKNEHFPSMDSLHSLDFEKLCDIKQGYLLRKEAEMTLSPVFGVINKESLSLYENDNVNSLITSYPLKELYMSTLDAHSNTPLA